MSRSNSNGNVHRESLNISLQICEAAQDAKGFDLAMLDISEVFQLSDYFVIASGRSDRHVQGIANRIIEKMKKKGIKPIAIEGFDRAHWVLIDFGEVIVHVFYEEMRNRYDLEALWLDAKPLNLTQLLSEGTDPVAA